MVTREACFVITIASVPKKDIFLVLPFLGSQSEVLARRVNSCVSKFYGFVNLRVIFNNTCRILILIWKERLNSASIIKSNPKIDKTIKFTNTRFNTSRKNFTLGT